MKKLITTASFVLLSAFVFAQDNYTIKMSVKVEGLPPEYAAYGEQEITNYLKGDKYKSEMSSMMGSNITAFDGKKLISINDAMGNKSGYTATKEEIEAAKEPKSETKPKIDYTTEKKTVAGYECTKAIITSVGKDKKENKMSVWVTEKIKNPEGASKSRRSGMADLGDLKGYPLEMELNQSQGGMDLKVLISTSEVSTVVIDDKTFDVNTDGYKMSTYTQHKAEMAKQAEAMKGK
jgi:hypothetical protein